MDPLENQRRSRSKNMNALHYFLTHRHNSAAQAPMEPTISVALRIIESCKPKTRKSALFALFPYSPQHTACTTPSKSTTWRDHRIPQSCKRAPRPSLKTPFCIISLPAAAGSPHRCPWNQQHPTSPALPNSENEWNRSPADRGAHAGRAEGRSAGSTQPAPATSASARFQSSCERPRS